MEGARQSIIDASPLKRAATMADVISLGVGEPDFVTPEHIRQAGIDSIHEGETHYTSNWGTLALRQAISENIERRYGVHYDPVTEVMVTAVSTGGSGGEDRLTENVTLNFAKVKVDYKEQTATGTAGATPSMTWDIAQNVNE